MHRRITIAGGGVSGLSLGIALARQDLPVTIHEALNYPRHRVCGEFISGAGFQVLQELGLVDSLFKAGARTASTVSFHTGGKSSKTHQLPSPALCISRFRFDQILANQFEKLGGDLRTNNRWAGHFPSPGVVRATGRRAELRQGEHVLGLKIHALNLELVSDLEMHFAPNAYFGLCKVEQERVNICGLFRIPAGDPEPARARWKIFSRFANGSLKERLAKASFDEASFCSVAALPLGRALPASAGEWTIGDAISMIPPITGNGISLALESAALSAAPLALYSTGMASWEDSVDLVNKHSRRKFSPRLRSAAMLHRLLFSPCLQRPLLNALTFMPFLLPWLFRKTRE